MLTWVIGGTGGLAMVETMVLARSMGAEERGFVMEEVRESGMEFRNHMRCDRVDQPI